MRKTIVIALNNNSNVTCFESIPVQEVKTKGNTSYIGVYLIPDSVVQCTAMMAKICDKLNPSDCEGSDYIVDDRFLFNTPQYFNYREVVFTYALG